MLLRDLQDVLYSSIGDFQSAVVWDAETHKVIIGGCSIEHALSRFGDWKVVRIGAVDDSIVLSVRW